MQYTSLIALDLSNPIRPWVVIGILFGFVFRFFPMLFSFFGPLVPDLLEVTAAGATLGNLKATLLIEAELGYLHGELCAAINTGKLGFLLVAITAIDAPLGKLIAHLGEELLFRRADDELLSTFHTGESDGLEYLGGLNWSGINGLDGIVLEFHLGFNDLFDLSCLFLGSHNFLLLFFNL